MIKVLSGSPRDKSGATPKQDKWKDPFYRQARGRRMSIKRRDQRRFVLPIDTRPPVNKRLTSKRRSGFSGFIKKVFRRKSF